jgi:hypothetical protein
MAHRQGKQGLKGLIRAEVRTTIRQTIASVIQEVTEEELRQALRDPVARKPLLEVVRRELEEALAELRSNTTRRRT